MQNLYSIGMNMLELKMQVIDCAFFQNCETMVGSQNHDRPWMKCWVHTEEDAMQHKPHHILMSRQNSKPNSMSEEQWELNWIFLVVEVEVEAERNGALFLENRVAYQMQACVCIKYVYLLRFRFTVIFYI